MGGRIKDIIGESIDVKRRMLADHRALVAIEMVALACVKCLKNDGKVLLCGNGGSAADAQHIAAELTGKFNKDRKPLHADALSVNTSHLTAVANDLGFDQVFARQIEAKGRRGDVCIAISTSGASENVIQALLAAKKLGLITVGLTGAESASAMAELCDLCIHVPSSNTARIQEAHILIGHVLCEMIESSLFPDA